MSRREFASLVEQVWPAVTWAGEEGGLGDVTTFEMLTAMAFVHFDRIGADFQVIEVGLGGRLDSTNIVEPTVSVITSISLDHVATLGDTVARIAREKAGIIKAGVPVVVAPQPEEAMTVFREVARVLRVDGFYRFNCSNPFTHAVDDGGWDGKAYPLCDAYVDGAEIVYDDAYWEFEDDHGVRQRIRGPREFRHTLSTLLNGLVAQGFLVLRVREESTSQSDPEPGSWEHYKLIAAPYLTFWASYRPYVFSAGVALHP